VSTPTADQVVARQASVLCDAILERVGAETVRTVFAGGSLATGEVAACARDGELEVYSDIDLYVVATAGADITAVRSACDQARMDANAPDGVRFMRGADIGVYTSEDLLAQPARPGTVDLAGRHFLLYGDENIFDELAHSIPSAIPGVEALYLIENRVAELSALRAGPVSPRLERFYVLKLALDLASAYAVYGGCYTADPGERIARFLEVAGKLDVPGDERALIEAAGSARADLCRYLDDPPEHLSVGAVELASVSAWQRIAASTLAHRDPDIGSLLERRCHRGDYSYNFRQFVTMRRRQGLSRARAAWSGVHLLRYAPLDALRVAALADHAAGAGEVNSAGREALDAIGMFLDRLTAACGHNEGTIAERSRTMFRAVG